MATEAIQAVNPETRYSAQWIVAQQGMGKTNALLHMLASDLQKDASVIILDAKGDLTNPIRHLSLGPRLIIIDPQHPFAINPLSVPKTDIKRAVNFLEYIFAGLLEANVTAKQRAFLRAVLRAVLLGFPDPTLELVRGVITNGPKPYREHIAKLPPDLQDFFNVEWGDYDSTRNELKWRMRLLLENELIARMFSARQTRFHIAEAMDAAKVVVIDNSVQHLHEDGSAFLGRFFLAQIWAAAVARSSLPMSKKKPVYVYIDEAHRIISEKIAQIIDECRSQNIALILAHQRTKQIQDASILNALENCAIKMVNVDAEAHYFSNLLHIPEERMNQLPRGHFAMHVRGEGSSIVQVPRASLPYPPMSPLQEADLLERLDTLYGVIPEAPLSATKSTAAPTDGAADW